ncbi:MAG: hypothetical protein PHV32_05930 [Eubacteriales bacterium]|nr:hypothetical protein [Eubacteriales bacterium]
MRKKIVRMLSLLLVLCTVISAASIQAFALSWDGSSTGGGGNTTSAGPNGYAIRTDADNCIGYRFSVVDKNGNTKNGAVIDVFRNTSYGNMEYGSAYKFNTKYNKKQLINNQNYGFSTSKNTNNCFKEANMGFASGLPAPSGMNSWQNNKYNLNPVLYKLSIDGINSLKNGDKVLVEPLYDLRLESVYHAVTVTETAIYGKYILGASSNGGSSYTPASWGFISSYTNKYYPNELYTPDGQGLWLGVSALSSRATFYTLINSGYGVGIAYTETKPDFTPTLSVRCVEAWPGNQGNRNNHYGISYGSAFANYTYGNGYPVLGDKVWFAVNFPAESENCYVRQTVWVDGGGSATRNVYSHNGTWYDVALSPTTVDANRTAYVVKARVDWIDGNGNTLKWGAEKSFYIPVKPKINRYRVTATDIAGKVAAYNGSGGKSGVLYVGQRIQTKYSFTASNNWLSYNNLSANRFQWVNGAWSDTSDRNVQRARLSTSEPLDLYSYLGYYRVPDNSLGTDARKCVPFRLRSSWTTDAEHTTENSWIELPVVKSDAELLDIKLIDENGDYITGRNVWANQLVVPQYVYQNNTECTIYVQGYNNDGTQISGIYAIPANGQVAVNGKQLRVGASGYFEVWGGVYLEGAGKGSTAWEKDDFDSQNNNHWLRYWTIKNPLTIEAVKPNSSYREGVQVMTTFRIYNASPTAFIPSDNVLAYITVYNASVYGGRDVRYVIAPRTVVVPGNSNNIVYVKWTVPQHLGNALLDIVGTVQYAGTVRDTDVLTVDPVVLTDSQTPDTKYEASKPSGWSASGTPISYANTASWSEWFYENGGFVKKSYGLSMTTSGLTVTPDSNSPSSEYKDGVWNMKSGYGYSLNWNPAVASVRGKLAPASNLYTPIQNSYAMLPEFNYSTVYKQFRTLKATADGYCFTPNTAANNARLHFIPVWYPNGSYTVSAYAYDCWTPAGMIGARASSNSITITGSLYDDHYIGRVNG